MSWRMVDDEMLNLERLVRTMEEEEEEEDREAVTKEQENDEEDVTDKRKVGVQDTMGSLRPDKAVTANEQQRTEQEQQRMKQQDRTGAKGPGIVQLEALLKKRSVAKWSQEVEGVGSETENKSGGPTISAKTEQTAVSLQENAGTCLQPSSQGGEGEDHKGSSPAEQGRMEVVHNGRKIVDPQRSSIAADLPSSLPPVSRLLDELKHFDREKSLRKVKIEISLEDRDWGRQQQDSPMRRLSESSLEANEAVRQGDFLFCTGYLM
jgi:hypothetical protein